MSQQAIEVAKAPTSTLGRRSLSSSLFIFLQKLLYPAPVDRNSYRPNFLMIQLSFAMLCYAV